MATLSDSTKKFVKYPLRPDPNSNNRLKELIDQYEFMDQNIRLFFMSSIGDRPMRPNLGSPFKKYYGLPVTENNKSIIVSEIQSALINGFPNITIDSIDVENDEDNKPNFIISIEYHFRNEFDQLFNRKLVINTIT